MSPTDRRYTREHEWARLEGEVVTVGITQFAQEQLGDVVYVELPKIGATLTAMRPFGVVESVKAASDLFAPLSGEVTEVNTALDSTPELINQDPYERGWIIKARPSDPAQLDQLLTAEQYDQLVEGGRAR
jgi:glycine cleavage system H protein